MLLLGFFYLTRYLNVYIPINFYLFTRRPNSLFGGSAGGRGGIGPWDGVGRAGRAGGAADARGGFSPKIPSWEGSSAPCSAASRSSSSARKGLTSGPQRGAARAARRGGRGERRKRKWGQSGSGGAAGPGRAEPGRTLRTLRGRGAVSGVTRPGAD